MARRLTQIQRAARAYKRASDRYEAAKQALYRHFRSATAYRRAKQEIPSGVVAVKLGWRGGSGGRPNIAYTGYCEPVLGSRLLAHIERCKRLLAGRIRQRDEGLVGRRERLAQKRAEEVRAERLAHYRENPEDYTEYIGTVPAELGTLWPGLPETQRTWREYLSAAGKAVPPHVLVAEPCRKSGRFKVLALGVPPKEGGRAIHDHRSGSDGVLPGPVTSG